MTGDDTLPPSLEAPAAALVARYAGRYSPVVVRRRLPIFAEREARRELDRDAPRSG